MRRMLVIAIAVLLAVGGIADAKTDKVVAGLRKKEATVTRKCATELLKTAKRLTALKAYDEAREQITLAMTIAPADEKSRKACRKEWTKLEKKLDETPEDVAEKAGELAAARSDACAKLLSPRLDAWAKAERPEELARLATTAVGCFGEDNAAFEALDLTWFEPYLVWARGADVERWKQGDEFVDGAWVGAEKVKELDAEHADWGSPWVIGDGIHEVRTVMPLRAAKRVLKYVTSYRTFVIDYFDGEWEWKQSSAPLPIYLTETQADYQARLADFDPVLTRSKAAALYAQKTGGLSPVFLTFEPKIDGSTGEKIGWDSLLRDVRHEVTHQILFESAMAQGAGVNPTGKIDWVGEGIATFLGSHMPRKGRWRLARREQEPYGNGFEPGPFAWTKGNFDTVRKLDDYFTNIKPNLGDVYEYFVAATLCYFLLEGADRRYRKSMVALLVETHWTRGNSKTFSKCFGKVKFDEMQSEWRKFVTSISIQSK